MRARGTRGDFQGKRILVVEKDLLVPFRLYRLLEQFGAEVIGPVTFPEDVTLLLADRHLDGAILDSHMEADDRTAVLRALRHRHVPFVEACSCMNCVSGFDGCYRLTETGEDLIIVGRALFPGGPSGEDKSGLNSGTARNRAVAGLNSRGWTSAAQVLSASRH
jgi:CheY-like chemotaxis protein